MFCMAGYVESGSSSKELKSSIVKHRFKWIVKGLSFASSRCGSSLRGFKCTNPNMLLLARLNIMPKGLLPFSLVEEFIKFAR